MADVYPREKVQRAASNLVNSAGERDRGDIIECGADVTEYQIGDSVCCYGPLQETVINKRGEPTTASANAQGASRKNAVCYDPAQSPRAAWSGVAGFRRGCGAGRDGRLRFTGEKAGASVWLLVSILSNIAVRSPAVTVRTCLNPIGTTMSVWGN